MNLAIIYRALIAATMLSLAACGPSIGLKKDFQTHAFEVGVTTRNDVVNRLGLPQKIVKDDQGREHLVYEGAAHLVGLCVGCGIPSAPGLIPSMMSESAVKNGSAEYVFDTNGVMAAKFEPSAKKKR
jgi:hypothetical protein